MDFSKKMVYSTEELIHLYNDTSSGHFFDRSAMRFFKSRITGHFKRTDDKTAYFITTERGPLDSKRMATLRRATIEDFTGDDGVTRSKIVIDTMIGFNRLTMYQAKKALREAV